MPPINLTAIDPFLPWILPPLLGAFIGYVTNYIAIRMLFRPLRAWRILGIRVPLTPGIIPSKRGELAKRMGEMVGSHLLTTDDVGKTLEKEGFRQELRRTLDSKVDTFLTRELGPPETLIPQKYRLRFHELVELLQGKLIRSLFNYLESDSFADTFHNWFEKEWKEISRRDLESFLSPGQLADLRRHSCEKVHQLMVSPAVAETVGRYIDNYTDELLRSEKSLHDLLPDDIKEIIIRQIENEIPALLEKFGGMMHDPLFRKKLEKKGRAAIEAFLDSMDGLAGLLTGFVDMEMIYGKIPDFLDKAGVELSALLREEKTQQQVATMLRERVSAIMDKPLSHFVEKLPYDKVKKLRLLIRNKAIDAVRHDQTISLVTQGVEKIFDYIQDRSFERLAESLLPENSLHKAKQRLEQTILTRLRDDQARSLTTRYLSGIVDDWLTRRPLGTLSARIPADVKGEIEEGVYQQVSEVLRKEVPTLMSSLNVNKIVEDKVNALNLLQVEDLLMGIMKEQFKYINIFGAFLGFLIGLGNLLIFNFL